ncbi:LisH domain-containing protein armc9 [Perkinsus olseni]|uniref:LisH domain-containing protein ARMC9 n=1 Tax=Perkinsus olseni TaxID=32597 RepID=A0A7J6MFB5_PEROL|nr:LisH domain-containing protein armc9 [Perkinsus olseni]
MYCEGADQNDPESEPNPSVVSSADQRPPPPPPPWPPAPAPTMELGEVHSKLDVLLRTNQWLVDEIMAQRGDIRDLRDECDELRKCVNSLGFREGGDRKPAGRSVSSHPRVTIATQCDDLPTEEENALRSELLRAKLELNERQRVEGRLRAQKACKNAAVQTMETITRDNRVVLSDDVMWRTPGGLCVVGKYSVTSSTSCSEQESERTAAYGYNPQTPSSFYGSTCLPPTEAVSAIMSEDVATTVAVEGTTTPENRDGVTENLVTNGVVENSAAAKNPSSEPTTEPAQSETENEGMQCVGTAVNGHHEEGPPPAGDGSLEPEKACEAMELDGWTTLDFGNQMTELIVIEAVKEYLAHHCLIETLDMFTRESKALRVRESATLAGAIGDSNEPSDEPAGRGLLAAFDRDDQAMFFQLWQSSIPPAVRIKKSLLEFRLRVYFFTKACLEGKGHRPVSRINRSQADHDWSAYTVFLGRQRRLSDDSLAELMPYYVLPYIDAPQTNDLTKHIFTENWRAGVRAELEETVNNIPSGRRRVPLLYSIAKVQQVDHGFSPTNAAREAEIYGHAPDDPPTPHASAADPEMAADLYRLAEIGIRALQSDPSSEFAHDPRKVMEAHHNLERMRSGSQALLFGTATSIDQVREPPYQHPLADGLEDLPINKLPVPRTPSSAGSSRRRDLRYRQGLDEGKSAAAASSVPPAQCPPIDIQQLSHYLHSMRDSSEAMIPALRSIVRHIASPYEPIRKRRSCIFGLIGLGALGDPATTGDTLLLDLLCSPDVIVSDLAACMIGIISCEAIGRWFMAAESSVIVQLVRNMLQAPCDSPAFMHSLAALQRLSMRYNAQTVMLRENVVENMMGRIEQGMMSRFGVRWGLALVVCLCNRQEGIRRLSSDQGFLEVLVSLITSDDNYICESTYELIGYLLVGAPSDISLAVRREFEALGIEQVVEDQLDAISRDSQSDYLACQLQDLLGRFRQRSARPTESLMDRKPEDDATDTACYLSEEDLSPLLIKHWRQLPPNDLIVCHFDVNSTMAQGKGVISRQQAQYAAFIKRVNNNSLPLIRSTLLKASPRKHKGDPKRKPVNSNGRRPGQQPARSRPSRLSGMPQHGEPGGGQRSGRRR